MIQKVKESQLNKREIFVREASASDIPMMQAFILEHGQNPWNFIPEKEVKEHISDLKTRKVMAFLAEESDLCLGFVCFYFGLPSSCQHYEEVQSVSLAYLSEIVVHRDHVGQGIGGALIAALKKHLVSRNVTKLYAERHADNKASSGVMRKTGFEVVDEYSDEKRRPTGSRKTTVTRLNLMQPYKVNKL